MMRKEIRSIFTYCKTAQAGHALELAEKRKKHHGHASTQMNTD